MHLIHFAIQRYESPSEFYDAIYEVRNIMVDFFSFQLLFETYLTQEVEFEIKFAFYCIYTVYFTTPNLAFQCDQPNANKGIQTFSRKFAKISIIPGKKIRLLTFSTAEQLHKLCTAFPEDAEYHRMLRRLIEENAFLYSCTSGIRNIFIDKNGFVIKVRSDYGAFKFYFACFFFAAVGGATSTV